MALPPQIAVPTETSNGVSPPTRSPRPSAKPSASAVVRLTAVISAPLEDSSGPDQSDNTIMDSGAAYVFALGGGSWTQRAYLKAPLPNISDQFGSAIAISGDGLVIAVSAPSSDATVKDAGATFTFARLDDTWQLEHTLQAPTPTTGDQVGTSLSLSSPGAILAVGVALDSMTAAMSGAVYLFH